MYYQQGVNIEPRKFSYSCGAWRNRARTGSECTSHYIRKNVLLDLVLEDMRRVLRYVKEHEQDFICKATEYGDMEARKALAQQQKELFKAQARMTELDTLFRKLYEDNALGRLTDERFVFLTSGYEDEKKSLAARIDELQQQIATVTERKRDISRFIQIVGKYSDIQELTYENVHEFIDRILIHELDRETNTRKIEIHYSFVGQVDTEQEPTQVVNHDRRNMLLLSLSASPSSLDKRAYNLTGSFVCCFNISAPFQQQTNYSVLYDYTMFPNFFQPFAALFFRLTGTVFLLNFLLYQSFFIKCCNWTVPEKVAVT